MKIQEDYLADYPVTEKLWLKNDWKSLFPATVPFTGSSLLAVNFY